MNSPDPSQPTNPYANRFVESQDTQSQQPTAAPETKQPHNPIAKPSTPTPPDPPASTQTASAFVPPPTPTPQPVTQPDQSASDHHADPAKPNTDTSSNTDTKKPSKPRSSKLLPILTLALVIALIAAAGGLYAWTALPSIKAQLNNLFANSNSSKPTPSAQPQTTATPSTNPQPNSAAAAVLTAFASADEFKTYLTKGGTQQGFYGGFGGGPVDMAVRSDVVALESASSPTGVTATQNAPTPDRVSQTNVQVAGLDEPDIVKTNGKEIFVSSLQPYYGDIQPRILPTQPEPGTDEFVSRAQSSTQIIKGFPVEQLAKLTSLETAGDLLLTDTHLIVLDNSNTISGYSIANPEDPQQSWSFDLPSNHSLVTARQQDNQIILISQTAINRGSPCPYTVLEQGDSPVTIQCSQVFHPDTIMPVSSTYNVLSINAQTGAVQNQVAYVGTAGTSVVYVSNQAVYLTYSYSGNLVGFMADFYQDQAKDLVDQTFIDRLSALSEYDLSQQAKMTELQVIVQEWLQTLTDDARLAFENEVANRMEDYLTQHVRELEYTGIAKIKLDNLQLMASGTVPGHPLNQFSLDEHNQHLRIATTVGNNLWQLGVNRNTASVNDVYVLDSNLNQVGSVVDLGKTERIYSARFLGDTGYVVTFRETDPFYVLDLSDPNNPAMVGELKIPGYSSYLHPLTESTILGVGKEESQVKLSVFDVSDPSNPTEHDKYLLDEYWSEAVSNHHAFLQDDKHQVFFMPGSKGGYIFSYADTTLTLTKAVSNIQAKRALFINDYLYIVGNQSIVVLDETTWETTATLQL